MSVIERQEENVGNLAAIQQAAKTVSAIDRNQSDRIDAIEKRLGL